MKLLLLLFLGAMPVHGGPTEGYALLEGFVDVPTNGKEVIAAAEFASKVVSSKLRSTYHSKLVSISNAKEQIVAGVNYHLEMTLGITSCKKNKIDYDQVETCDFQDGLSPVCTVVIYKNLKQEYELTKFQCKPAPREQDQKVPDFAEKLMFKDFVINFKKSYKDKAEETRRYEIFQANLKKIKLLNDHERGTAHYGITEFTDMPEDEFKKNKLGLRPDLLNTDEPAPQAIIPNNPIPRCYDWRYYGVVTEVKNQSTCGSSWAFSTTGNIEGQWALKKKKLVSLSEQQLMDCDKVDDGCDGGLPSIAYKEIIRLGGLESEKDYPYEGTDNTCKLKKEKIQVYINSSLAISSNETKMAQWLVKNGPISIVINDKAMKFYCGGISYPRKFLCSPETTNRAVLIVGYGVKFVPSINSTMPFWIVKNSQGRDWGEEGYYRVYRGDGTCGLNTMATSAVVD